MNKQVEESAEPQSYELKWLKAESELACLEYEQAVALAEALKEVEG